MTATANERRTRQPHMVCREDELPAGGLRRLTVGRRQVVVAHVPGEGFVALSNYCPHQNVPLDTGTLERMWVSDEIGGHSQDPSRWVLICAQHNFEVDTKTGCPVAALGRRRAITYEVQVEDGEIVVYL